MRHSRYAPYPSEWDDEPDDADLLDDLEESAARWEAEHAFAVETPEGMPVDDLWHAQRAEDRDTFLHPPWDEG